MIKLVTPSEMNTILSEVEAGGLRTDQIIEDAARAVLHIIEAEYGYLAESGALGLIGPGLKGQITLAALTIMAQENWTVTAYLLPQHATSDQVLEKFSGLGGNVIHFNPTDGFKHLATALNQHSLWLDGIAEGDVASDTVAIGLLQHIEAFRPSLSMPVFILAIEGPSGVDLATGKVDAHALRADKTIGVAALKTGLMCPQALALCGELRLAEVGNIDQSATYRAIPRLVVDSDFTRNAMDGMQKIAPAHVCILGGSINQPGKILLAGQAALRSGAQLITLAAPAPLFEALAGHFPETAWLILPHELGVITPAAVTLLQKEIHPFTSLLIGTGIGLENTTKEFIGRLLDIPATTAKQNIGFVRAASKEETIKTHPGLPPLIIDVDGLGLLSQLANWQVRLPKETILILDAHTLAQISGEDRENLRLKWMTTLEHYAKEWNCVLVYLGFPIAIVSPEEGTAVISGNSIDFDKAGTGSLLAGIIAGLRGQGMQAFQAAATGAWLFRQAASAGIEQVGSAAAFVASDAAACLADIMLFIR
jgi:NAD(P)H-hydrate repair Nnr-like enzyme with NAD(P)H-hydrate dehydratase domain/NAD(P)H-hydrate repair Nnr-like enzyme with NAD(P)H-hydrate epimerase domain